MDAKVELYEAEVMRPAEAHQDCEKSKMAASVEAL
jgi:hypothetical protein